MSSTLSVAPTTMARVGTVDDRYQSYNVEMLEVTGGRFWKPYKDIPKTVGQTGSEAKAGDAPAGMSPDLYQYRPPIDLTNGRLRAMAGARTPPLLGSRACLIRRRRLLMQANARCRSSACG